MPDFDASESAGKKEQTYAKRSQTVYVKLGFSSARLSKAEREHHSAVDSKCTNFPEAP
jgi:hypothetical protein